MIEIGERGLLRKKKFLVGGLVVVLALSYLAYTGFQSSATYYYTVSEISAEPSDVTGQTLRVNGQVAGTSVEEDAATRTLKFTIVEGDDSLPVVYQGIVPDTFQAGSDVVVEGFLDSSGVFEAQTLMPKCASRYTSQG